MIYWHDNIGGFSGAHRFFEASFLPSQWVSTPSGFVPPVVVGSPGGGHGGYILGPHPSEEDRERPDNRKRAALLVGAAIEFLDIL